MHFLIDASLPTASGDVIRAAGHQATDVRDVGLGTADDAQIADFAKLHQYCICSADQDFGNIRDYPPADYAGIVGVRPPATGGRAIILSLINQFLQQTDLLSQLSGRLAIVEPGRIRLRPAT